MFVDKLKSIELLFERPVSSINKKITLEPVSSDEVLEMLKTQHGIPLTKDNIKMGLDIDTIGEHLINANYTDQRFKQDFSFMITLQLKAKKAKGTI